RVAVVTGANKGIGLETVRQLASHGVTVVLTARDAKRGSDAASKLHQMGFPNVIFHQLDVLDPASIQNLAEFLKGKFGKLDILVRKGGFLVCRSHSGCSTTLSHSISMLSGKAVNLVQDVMKHTYEKAEECLNTNYYAVKNLTESLLPLLQLSDSGARIVNVTSLRGELCRIRSDDLRKEFAEVESLSEEKLDEILKRFLRDFKENKLEAGGWSLMLPAYSVSKVTLNAYTRMLARRHPNMKINCVHPGYVNTDLNWHTGPMPVEEGARGSVKCALLPNDGPTGCYFDQTEVASF
ncbi:unnamed protein product, partial [Linum tenue]